MNYIRENITDMRELIRELNFILRRLNTQLSEVEQEQARGSRIVSAQDSKKVDNTKHPVGGAYNLTFVAKSLGLKPLTASDVPNGTLFIDSADNELKFKDNVGTVNQLY